MVFNFSTLDRSRTGSSGRGTSIGGFLASSDPAQGVQEGRSSLGSSRVGGSGGRRDTVRGSGFPRRRSGGGLSHNGLEGYNVGVLGRLIKMLVREEMCRIINITWSLRALLRPVTQATMLFWLCDSTSRARGKHDMTRQQETIHQDLPWHQSPSTDDEGFRCAH